MSNEQAGGESQVAERSAADVRKYARRRYALVIAHLALGIAFLAAMLAGGSVRMGAEARDIAGPDSFLLTVFLYFAGFSLGYLIVALPLSFYSEYVLEHRTRFKLERRNPVHAGVVWQLHGPNSP